MSTETASLPAGYAIGPFTVDCTRRLLWQDGTVVPLNGKTFEVLVLLLAGRDRIVTKEELLRQIWPDTFVQENNLARHVSTLRKALGEGAERHDFILTVQGRGYRFVAPVVELRSLPAEVLSPAGPITDVPRAKSPAPSQPVPARPAPVADPAQPHPAASQRRRMLAAGLGLAAMAAGVLVIRPIWTDRRPSAPPSARVFRQLTYGPDAEMAPTWSPDGHAFAYASDRNGNFDLYVQAIDGTDPIRLTSSPEHDWEPAWSPDGRWLAYRSERDGGGLYLVSSSGGPERRLTDFGFAPQWSADSTRILFRSSELGRARPRAYVVGLDGAAPEQVLGDVTDQFFEPQFAWHPDGSRISVSGSWRAGGWRFVTVPVSGGPAVVSEIPEGVLATERALDLTLGRFVWAPNGRRLYFEGRSHEAGNLWAVEVDATTMQWRGSLERITTGPGRDRGLSISRDGQTIAFETASERTRIWAFHVDPKSGSVADQGTPVTAGAAGEFDAAISRDGRQLVYRTVRDGRQELWQRSIPEGRERRLLADPNTVRSVPRWSPDGASLSYLINYVGTGAHAAQDPVLAVLSTARGSERLLPGPDRRAVTPDDWTADGRSILGACRPDSGPRTGICLVSAYSDAPATVLVSDADASLHNARFSPDQRWIVFTRSPGASGTSTVCVRAVNGGPVITVTDGGSFEDKARWSPDGRAIYFVSNRNGRLNVWGRRFDLGNGRAIGDVFQATHFTGLRRGLATDLNLVDFAMAAGQLFVPVTETTAQIWSIEGLTP